MCLDIGKVPIKDRILNQSLIKRQGKLKHCVTMASWQAKNSKKAYCFHIWPYVSRTMTVSPWEAALIPGAQAVGNTGKQWLSVMVA